MVCLAAMILMVAPLVYAQDTLITKGAVWKYLDDGSDQGTAWIQPDFNDSSWAEGKAELGYGDGDETTVIHYGADPQNKYITYYFRKRFNVDNPARQNWLKLYLLRDDGAVVYINGHEVVRSNMPGGTITYKTLATESVYSTAEKHYYDYFVLSSYLTQGENVIAVEVHQISRTDSDVSFDLELVFTSETPAIIRKGPYLIYPEKNTEMTVLWQLRLQLPSCQLQWGTGADYATDSAEVHEYNGYHQYKYTIQGLRPGTFYRYRMIAATDTFVGSFRTAPDSTSKAIKFIAYGDTRSQPNMHNLVAKLILATIAADSGYQSFLLATGDLVAHGDNESDWDQQFFNRSYTSIQQMLANLPYLAAIGNHEGQGKLFAKYFPYYFIQNGRYYWSFDYGPAHFTIIDQQNNYSPGSSQYSWIEQDLANTHKKWKFVVLHKPGWSAGGHSNNFTVQKYIQPLCKKYGVKIVFAGHNHYYARAVVNGVYHITTGGGGAPLYSPDASMPYIVKASRSYHVCMVEIDGDTLRLTAVSTSNHILDQFTITATPTNVAEQTPIFPKKYRLYPAYPNPFNLSTTFRFELPHTSPVELSIFNLQGRLIRHLVRKNYRAGTYQVLWNGKSDDGWTAASGFYLVRFRAGKYTTAQKILLLK